SFCSCSARFHTIFDRQGSVMLRFHPRFRCRCSTVTTVTINRHRGAGGRFWEANMTSRLTFREHCVLLSLLLGGVCHAEPVIHNLGTLGGHSSYGNALSADASI